MEQTPSQMHVPIFFVDVKATIDGKPFRKHRAFPLHAMTLTEFLQLGKGRRQKLSDFLTEYDGHFCEDGNVHIVISTAPDSIKKCLVPNLCVNMIERIFDELVAAFVPVKNEMALVPILA